MTQLFATSGGKDFSKVSSYYDEIRQQVLDGKRSWNCRDEDDADDFLTKVVGAVAGDEGELRARRSYRIGVELTWAQFCCPSRY
jgi:hypothetical protein